MIYNSVGTNIIDGILSDGDPINTSAKYGTAWRAYIYKGSMPTIAAFETNFNATTYGSLYGVHPNGDVAPGNGTDAVIGSEVIMYFESTEPLRKFGTDHVYYDTTVTPTKVTSWGSHDITGTMTWAMIIPAQTLGSGGIPMLDYTYGPAPYGFMTTAEHSYMLVPVSDTSGDGVIKLSSVTNKATATISSITFTIGGV